MRSWSVTTSSPSQTQMLGILLGEEIAGPTVILLSGDLGAGKTCFTQGVARGLGVPADEPITSPTYTLMNQYRGRLSLYHFDLYRLSHSDDLMDIDLEDAVAGDGVVVVEWADRFPEYQIEGLEVHIGYLQGESRCLELAARTRDGENLLSALEKRWQSQF